MFLVELIIITGSQILENNTAFEDMINRNQYGIDFHIPCIKIGFLIFYSSLSSFKCTRSSFIIRHYKGDITPFRSSTICSLVALRLCAMIFCLYISSYLAPSIASPVRRYSKMLRLLLPLKSDTVHDSLMLTLSSIFGVDSVLLYVL